jgi:cytochrome c553
MKRSLLSLLLAAIAFGVAFGVQASDDSHAAHATSKGDAARGEPIATTVCAACHGADGNSSSSANPKLAGQHPEYLFKQMKNFKAAEGKQPERTSAIMNGMIAAFDENQMRDFAAYFASKKQVGETAKNRETVEAGQKLYRAGNIEKGLPACAACHGPAGAGIPAQYPRIAGQFAEYTEAQLKSFRDLSRTNDPAKMMQMIAIKMTDVEIKAVADYIAGLR